MMLLGDQETSNHQDAVTQSGRDEEPIIIESDQEEDQRIVREARPVRLVPDGRLNRPRDGLNRFLNSQGTNVAAMRSDTNSTTGGSDDEVAIVREVSMSEDLDRPIGSDAEYVDLEREFGPEGDSVIINHNSINNTPDDDGVVIVQERSTAPRVTLNLPGGETLEIDASPTDRPYRRSFEWQEDRARPQMLRRSARRASRLLFHHSDDEERDTSETSNHLPPNVIRLRRQEQHRLRQAEMARRRDQRQWNNIDGNPVLQRLRERIDSFPPGVRSAFDHAQSLHEFRSILQSVAPLTLQECDNELVPLFTEYRSRMVQNWAVNRVQLNQEEARRLHEENFERQRRLRQNRRHFRIHMGVGGGFGESLANYILMNANGNVGAADAAWFYNGFYEGMNEEESTQNIVNMIQEREEREHDCRTKKFMEKTHAQQQSFVQRALELPDGYSANFDTEPKVKLDIVRDGKQETVIVQDDSVSDSWLEVPVCTLCGVELGVGIPDEFEGIAKLDRGVSFECLVYKYQFHCPYQTLARPSQLDRDLSRRTFVAPCGHTYCGRCFARIDNARGKCRMARKKLAQLRGSAHPDNYGPKICPAEGCKSAIRTRGKMREAFF
ncbi:SLX5 (YDL013W) [Zygosaccharomyces parabailii]|nr:SLX5 (YDL013W) [Zygosaccharomyces parabailii]